MYTYEKFIARRNFHVTVEKSDWLFNVVIYLDFYLDVAQVRTNGTANETRTNFGRFASLTCKPLYHQSPFIITQCLCFFNFIFVR